MKILFSLLFIICFVSSCATAPIQEPSLSSAPISTPLSMPPSAPAGGAALNIWPFQTTAEKYVTSRLLAASPGAFCPQMSRPGMDRAKVLQGLLGAIAWTESSWQQHPNPYLEKTQGVDKVTGLPTYSQGVFQLSYQDATNVNYRGLAHCKLISYPTRNIEDLDINIGCALEIMDNLAGREPGLDLSTKLKPYWSSVNPARPGYQTTLAKMKKLMPECFP